jgi:hypothetical protein
VESIGKRLFKDTECGISFNAMQARVIVAGYAEGSDAELPCHALEYPFTSGEFDALVILADAEGSQEWDEANDESGA